MKCKTRSLKIPRRWNWWSSYFHKLCGWKLHNGRDKEHRNLKKKKQLRITICAVLSRLAVSSALRPHDPTDRSPPGSSVVGSLQARALQWAAPPPSHHCIYTAKKYRKISTLQEWLLPAFTSILRRRFFTDFSDSLNVFFCELRKEHIVLLFVSPLVDDEKNCFYSTPQNFLKGETRWTYTENCWSMLIGTWEYGTPFSPLLNMFKIIWNF